MVEHHPAIAEQIAKYEEEIAECTASLAHHEREQTRLVAELRGHQCVLAAYIDAEERLTAALSGVSPENAEPTPSGYGIGAGYTKEQQGLRREEDRKKRMKRDVRGAVIARFDERRDAQMSEAALIAFTGLPEPSVHAYLGRAVKAGELEREGDLYRLPGSNETRDWRTVSDAELEGAEPEGEITNDDKEWANSVIAARSPAEGAPWPPSPEKIVDTIRRAGDMGMSRDQLLIIGATDTQITFLEGDGDIHHSEFDGRYRAAAFAAP